MKLIVKRMRAFLLATGAIVGSLALTTSTTAGSDPDRTSSPGTKSIPSPPGSGTEIDRRAVAALDTEYQRAVKNNDVATMARILADDFVVVEGNGNVWSKADLLESAGSGKTHYEHQEDSEQSVRVWGHTAVVTAKLWAKGVEDGKPAEYTEWFSDTYVRTPSGWKYVFGQASLPLPEKAKHKT